MLRIKENQWYAIYITICSWNLEKQSQYKIFGGSAPQNEQQF